jgi:hypothetical protein
VAPLPDFREGLGVEFSMRQAQLLVKKNHPQSLHEVVEGSDVVSSFA